MIHTHTASTVLDCSHYYWSKAFPLYGKNYGLVLEAIERMEKNLPGFFYAGNCLLIKIWDLTSSHVILRSPSRWCLQISKLVAFHLNLQSLQFCSRYYIFLTMLTTYEKFHCSYWILILILGWMMKSSGNHKGGLSVGKAIASGCKAADLVISYLNSSADDEMLKKWVTTWIVFLAFSWCRLYSSHADRF